MNYEKMSDFFLPDNKILEFSIQVRDETSWVIPHHLLKSQ